MNTTTTPLILDTDTASILFFQNHFHLKIREFEFYTIYKRMLLYTRDLQKINCISPRYYGILRAIVMYNMEVKH